MAWAALAQQAAGSEASAFGQIQQGKAQAASDTYNAQVSDENKQLALQNSSYAGQEGEAQVERQELKNRAQLGSIKANQAAGGIDVNKGSAVDVQASADSLGQLDALTLRSEAARKAYGYQLQASGDAAQTALDRKDAKNAIRASYIGAATTLLSASGNAAQNSNLSSGKGRVRDDFGGANESVDSSESEGLF